jgi:2-keto-4-pentenoate hydratase/2-oxohepta-3-ene-1,7-dioic acid hydratase in catechol pathway
VRFAFFNNFVPGVVADNRVIDVSSLLEARTPEDAVLAFIENYDSLKPGIEKLIAAGGGVLVDEVRLRQPLPHPVQLLCATRNYQDGHEIPKPDFFLKAQQTIIGPGDTIVLPAVEARTFHAEPELAVVIKKMASHVKAADAKDYIFGYTGFIDFSARGVSSGYYIHKSFATFGPMGPYLVTADEVRDPQHLNVRLSVNDQLRQDFSTGAMTNPIATLIEAASAVCPLLPGDVIATGTHHNGLGPVGDGDKITVEFESVGTFTVYVSDSLKRKWDTSDPAQGSRIPTKTA